MAYIRPGIENVARFNFKKIIRKLTDLIMWDQPPIAKLKLRATSFLVVKQIPKDQKTKQLIIVIFNCKLHTSKVKEKEREKNFRAHIVVVVSLFVSFRNSSCFCAISNHI